MFEFLKKFFSKKTIEAKLDQDGDGDFDTKDVKVAAKKAQRTAKKTVKAVIKKIK